MQILQAAPITESDLKNLEISMGLRFAGLKIGAIFSSQSGAYNLITLALFFAGVLLLLYLIVGGIGFMLSRGDPKALESAKGRITDAFIGFIIVFCAFWIVQIVGLILRLPDVSNIFSG